MELVERLKLVRDSYIDCLVDSLKNTREEWNADADEDAYVAAEILFHIPNSQRSILEALYRVDIAARKQEKLSVTEVNVDPLRIDSETYYIEGALKVTINEFAWNEAEFHSKIFDLDIDPFVEWYHKWLDTTDAIEYDDSGLCQVIHSVSVPELSAAEDEMFFAVDFGSAPVEAFMELLEILSKVGIDAVSVRTSLSSEEVAG